MKPCTLWRITPHFEGEKWQDGQWVRHYAVLDALLRPDAPLIINLRFQRARSLAPSPYPHRVGTGRMAPSAIIRCTNSRAARICASAWA